MVKVVIVNKICMYFYYGDWTYQCHLALDVSFLETLWSSLSTLLDIYHWNVSEEKGLIFKAELQLCPVFVLDYLSAHTTHLNLVSFVEFFLHCIFGLSVSCLYAFSCWSIRKDLYQLAHHTVSGALKPEMSTVSHYSLRIKVKKLH